MNKIDGWRVYNHALLPTTPPHEEPNLLALKKVKKWYAGGVLMARYTTNFDCGYETEWWWLIKDDFMDLDKLNAKRRYEIKSGLKNCEVKKISSKVYAEQIYSVYDAAVHNYKMAGKIASKENFITQCINEENDMRIEYYGAFLKNSDILVGYAQNYVYEDRVNFSSMKFSPQYLNKKVSAALVYIMLCDYLNIQHKKYVCDGERSIRHFTNFQDYLIKYFGFRRAYCKLHIEYRPVVGFAIKIVYPFRQIVKKMNICSVTNNIMALLDMEYIRRSYKI